MKDKTIILGAGITGLAAGYKTGFPIYEANKEPGGICRSYDVGRYHFNFGGGHWIFGPEHIKSFVSKFSPVDNYIRNAGVYYNHTFPSPIQNYTLGQSGDRKIMKHWLRDNFGNDLCQMFFYPFNEKYTCGLYDRIIQDNPEKSPVGKDKPGYNDSFCYPIRGMSDFIDKLADGLDIKYSHEAVKIDLDRKIVYFGNGAEVEYSRLISTLPLKKLLSLAGIEVDDLPYTSVLVLNIGGDCGPRMPQEQWVYVPFSDSGFFRVGFYSNVDKSYAPIGQMSAYVEKSFLGKDGLRIAMGDYIRMVEQELEQWGFIDETRVCSHNWIEYAYTWAFRHTDRSAYLNMLREKNVESLGRYGRWRFQGIAESLQDGLSLA